ncbi:MAG: hypothetical protein V1820_00450 [archaeon]
MFKSSSPAFPEKFMKIEPLSEDDADDDFEEMFGEDADELIIDLEAVLKHHRAVRIRVPAIATSVEGSSEDGAREIVVSKGSEEETGVVF